MSSIFSKIVDGKIPCYKIAETDTCLSFLDINPLTKGHVLVIPKNEVDSIFDLKIDLYNDLWLLSKYVANAIEESIPCKRVGIAVIGLEVPHAHVHLVPLQEVGDINFSKPKVSFLPFEMEQICESIKSAIRI